MKPGAAGSQRSSENLAGYIREEPGSQTSQPPLKPCFLNIHTEEEFRQQGDCVRRLSSREPLGALPTLLAAPGPAPEPQRARRTCGKQPALEMPKHREGPSLICMQRQHATGSEVTTQHVVWAIILRQVSILNPKLHLGVVNIC